MPQGRHSFGKLFWTLVLCGVLVYGVVVVMDPWSVHMGGRRMPLLTWHGSGDLLPEHTLARVNDVRVPALQARLLISMAQGLQPKED